MNVVNFQRKKALTAKAALAHLAKIAGQHPDGAVVAESVTALGLLLGWPRPRTSRQLTRWKEAGSITADKDDEGRIVVRIMPGREGAKPGPSQGTKTPKVRVRKRAAGRAGGDADTDRADRDKTANSTVNSSTSADQVAAPIPPPEAPAERAPAPEKTSTPTPEIPPAPTSSDTANQSVPRGAHMGFFTRKAAAKAADTTPAPDTPAPAEEAARLPRHESREVERARAYGHVAASRGGEVAGPGFDMADAFGKASTMEKLLVLIAAGLSATAAYVSVNGMVTLYPSGAAVVMVLGALIEAAKFTGFGVVSAGWRTYSFLSRWLVSSLLTLAALVNGAAVYGWLVSSHAGPVAERTAAYTAQDARQGSALELAQTRLADVQQRIRLIDEAAEGAARRGRSKSAISAMRSQQRDRANLVSERDRLQQELSDAKTGRTDLAARHQVDEAAALPVRYAAALFEDLGVIRKGTDPETLIRWISLMILLCADPLALAVMVMINSRTRRSA